jgi:hypothetical protein
VFIAPNISKEKQKKRRFWVRQTLIKRKILTCTSLAYCTFQLLKSFVLSTLRKVHTVLRPVCRGCSWQQNGNLLITDRPRDSVQLQKNTWKLQKCFINVAEFLQICRKTKSCCCVSVFSG